MERPSTANGAPGSDLRLEFEKWTSEEAGLRRTDPVLRALLLDEVAVAREIIGRELVKAGFRLAFSAEGRESVGSCISRGFDLIVIHHDKAGIDPVAFIRHLRRFSSVPVVVITSCGSVSDCEQAMRVGANRFLLFRDDVGRLGEVARQLVDAHPQRRHSREEWTTERARALGQYELEEVLRRLLIECRGNISEIARRMDRDRSTVRYHLRKMGMLD